MPVAPVETLLPGGSSMNGMNLSGNLGIVQPIHARLARGPRPLRGDRGEHARPAPGRGGGGRGRLRPWRRVDPVPTRPPPVGLELPPPFRGRAALPHGGGFYASTSRSFAANAAGTAPKPPWSPGNATAGVPSSSARAIAARLGGSPSESSPITGTTRTGDRR